MTHALMNIQVIPKADDPTAVYPAIDAAIELVQQSAMPYEVGALGTTVEGELDALVELARQMNEVVIERGCESVISQVRLYLGRDPITMDSLTDKFRD